MKIEILGTGCPKCKKLNELTEETVNELVFSAKIIKVTDINKIDRLWCYSNPCFSY